MGKNPFLSVAVVTNVAGASGRDHLSGVFKYVNTGKPWRLRLLNHVDELLRTIAGNRPDGAITITPNGGRLDRLLASGVPCAITDYPPPGRRAVPPHVSFVHLDDESIGREAFAHFQSRGRFNAFAFVLDEPDFLYAKGRLAGFSAAAQAEGHRVHAFELPEADQEGRARESVARKILRLPRPLAVLAARDRAALKVLDMLRAAGIEVPGQVAVLGVDNDELLCNAAEPPLSSIHPDHERIGFLAAHELDRLMKRGKGKVITLDRSVKDLIMRRSTLTIPPAGRLITEALAFIQRNAGGDLRVPDVIAHLGCSRRLADLRFRQIRNETIQDAIDRARLGHLKKRLMATSDPVARIAADSGFSSAAVLTRFFVRHTGRPPSAWRR
ncbi:MAG: substrate-binding domain-containing protein [Kiritimatiellae bacterium]|nr:substrate-binding domain-containing protein [Kiritimatiellia bacterium]